MASFFGGEHIICEGGDKGQSRLQCFPTWQRVCHCVSGKDSVIRGYHPKAGTTPKISTSPTGAAASRSSLTSDSAAVIICSLSGTEKSNCSLCGLKEMYLQLLGALF